MPSDQEPRLTDVELADILYGLWRPEFSRLGEGHPLRLFLHEANQDYPDTIKLGRLMVHVWRFVLDETKAGEDDAANVLASDEVRSEGARRWALARLTRHFLDRLNYEAIPEEPSRTPASTLN